MTVLRFAPWPLVPGRSIGATWADYLGRLWIAAREASREALNELHEAHVRSFTFDNIHVLLGQHPASASPRFRQQRGGRRSKRQGELNANGTSKPATRFHPRGALCPVPGIAREA